jgi:lysophospholipase L1-like esterase
MIKFRILFFILISALFSSCLKTEFDEFELNSGSVNFSNYVAVGNSLTQGYQDGGLHNENGQHDNSYPAILAGQFKLVEPSLNFLQPPVIGSGSGHIHLEFRDGEIEIIKRYDPESTTNDPSAIGLDPSWLNFGDHSVRYNNLGVSGIKLAHTSGGGESDADLNYFFTYVNEFARFLDWGTVTNKITYLDHVKASNATFFTNWLGNNDVLGWSTGGGDDGYREDFNRYFYKLTDPTEFRNKYDSVLTAFKNMGAQGICATIPNVTTIPFFNTVTLESVGADVWITEGPYANNPGLVRKATTEDLLLLTSQDSLKIGIGLTETNPLTHTNVLDKDEKILAQNRSSAYNEHIRALAAKHGFAFVDMYSYLDELKSGLTFDGVDFSTKYIEGGAFSLDGVHPNTRGYAIIANKFIKTINEYYGAKIPPVIVSNYNGVILP